jgi:ribonuclease J
MKIRIHRGATEIGGSCVEVEASGQRILLDAGLPISRRADVFPIPPNIAYDTLSGIVISHPHLDHYGLLPWIPSAPVAMGAKARQILLAAAPFMRLMSLSLAGPDLIDRQPIKIGPFCITPFLVDHSAYDAYALLIEADGKRLFYSGDFRGHGRKHGLVDELIAHPPSDIDTLLLEGTTMSRADENTASVSEHELEEEFVSRFLNTTGLVLIHASAQNIDRMVSVYRACQRTGRTLVIDLYTAMILEATGNPRIPQSHWERVALCVPKTQRIQIKRNGWFDKLDRHSRHRIFLKRHLAKAPDNYALLFRGLWMRDLEQADVLEGGCLIHSQWEGYLREQRFQEIEAWRKRHGLQYCQIHTSGHASPADLKRFAAALSPKTLVPIHTAAPESFTSMFPHVVRHADGEWWEV